MIKTDWIYLQMLRHSFIVCYPSKYIYIYNQLIMLVLLHSSFITNYYSSKLLEFVDQLILISRAHFLKCDDDKRLIIKTHTQYYLYITIGRNFVYKTIFYILFTYVFLTIVSELENEK